MLKSMSEYNVEATNSDIRIINHDSRKIEFINDETIDFICIIHHIWQPFHMQNIKNCHFGG